MITIALASEQPSVQPSIIIINWVHITNNYCAVVIIDADSVHCSPAMDLFVVILTMYPMECIKLEILKT